MEPYAPARWANVNVPPGYRFKPTPRELIQCYLEPWVGTEPGQQSPGEFYGIMAAADVYGEDPATLTPRFQHIAHDDGNWYFLSVSRWKDGNASSRRMSRVVGDLGTWHGSGKKILVRGVGYRQTFEFRPASGAKAAWLMEEFGTVRDDANGQDGVRVLCRLHLSPKAAAAYGGSDRHQQQIVEAVDLDVPAPCHKRQRQRAAAAAARQLVEHHFDADYWTAVPNVAFSSSYATAPVPPDLGCSSSSSYASTSSQAATAPVAELAAQALAACWQHQPPMMEQAAGDEGYQCIGADDVEFTAQDFNLDDSDDFVFTAEHLLQLDDGWNMDSNSNAVSFLPTVCDGVQGDNDLKPEPSADGGVQENDGDGPKGDAGATC